MNKLKLFSALCAVTCIGLVVYGTVTVIDMVAESVQAAKPVNGSAKPILTTSQHEWVKECAKYTEVNICLFRLGDLKQEQVWN
jgi:hypothetical protein